MLKDLKITVGKTHVAGTLEAEPNSIVVQIQAPFRNLKYGQYLSSVGNGFHRYVHNGKLAASAIETGEEILKGLYLAGQYLQRQPEFIQRLEKYIARFERRSREIQRERRRLHDKLKAGELTPHDYAAQMNEQLLAERQNVLERGSIFRRYAEELTQQSGGRSDIHSVLRFNLPAEDCPVKIPSAREAATSKAYRIARSETQ